MRRSFDNNNKEIPEALFQFQISFRKTHEKGLKGLTTHHNKETVILQTNQ